MSSDMKLIILANMNVKLFSWTFTFHKVVRQQIWGEVLVLIQASSSSELNSEKYENWCNFVEVVEKNKSDPLFSETGGIYGTHQIITTITILGPRKKRQAKFCGIESIL